MKRSLLLISSMVLIQLSTFVNNQLCAQTLIQAQTGFYINSSSYDITDEWYTMNGSLESYWSCPGNYSNEGALKIAVFDSLTCEPWMSPASANFVKYKGPYGEYHCQESFATPAFDFFFMADSNRTTVRKFLDTIPQNDYVLVMTHQNAHYQDWDNLLITAFRSIGSTISQGSLPADSTPYIIIGRKGAIPGSVPEIFGTSWNLINLSATLPCHPISIAEINIADQISIFPNPATDKLYIETSQKASIEILNIEGQLIATINDLNNVTSINISGLANGMYFVKVKTEKGIAVKKFIKE